MLRPDAPAPPKSRVKLYDKFDLTKELVRLSRHRDKFTGNRACEGVILIGSLGSAKSTSSLDLFGTAYLQARPKWGAIILCAKASAAEDARKMVYGAGRAADLIEYGPETDECLNWLDWEYRDFGDGVGRVDNLMEVFNSAMEIMQRSAGQKESEPFWKYANDQGMKNLFFIDAQGNGSIDLSRVLEMWQTLPRDFADLEEPDKFASLRTLLMAEMNCSPEQKRSLKMARNWILEMAGLSERTKSCIQQMAVGMIDPHARDLMHRAMGRKSTWTPEDICERGKIVLISYDVKRYGMTGKLVNVLTKRCVERAIERRLAKYKGNMKALRPVAIICDEMPYFIDSADLEFLRTCRESRAACLWSFQSIPSVVAEFGGSSMAETQVKSILSLFGTKIIHQNDDPDTNKALADMISQDLRLRESYNQGQTPGGSSSGRTWNLQWEHVVPTIAMKELKRGGAEYKWDVRAIMTMAGYKWHETGKSACAVKFFQNVPDAIKENRLLKNFPRAPIYMLVDSRATARSFAWHTPIWRLLWNCCQRPHLARIFIRHWLGFWMGADAAVMDALETEIRNGF